jgi:ankyrin repeat protein
MWGLHFGDPTRIAMPPDGDEHPMCLNMQPGLREHLAGHPETLTAVDERGFTLLHTEALAGNAASVETLMAYGADPRVRTRAGKTPLDLARLLGWPKVEAALSRNA